MSGATSEAVLTEPLHPTHSWPSTMLTSRQRRMPGAVVVVELHGEVDLATEEVMRDALTGAVRIADLELLICDMTHVGFFGCVGLTILLQIQAVAHLRGAQMRVVTQSPMVLLLLDVTRLSDTLGLCASMQEAIQTGREA